MKRSVLMLVVLMILLFGGSVFAGAIENRLSEAKKLFDQGKYSESEKMYRDILSAQKDELNGRPDLKPRVWQGLGESLMRQGKTKDAQRVLERVGAHQGQKVEVEDKTASVAATLAKSADGATGEELTSSKNSEVKELYRNATSFLSSGGSKIVVVSTLLEACKKEPNNPVLVSKTVGLILETSETFYKEARNLMESLKVSQKGSFSEEAQILYARTLFSVAPFKYDEAKKILDEIIKTSPKNVPALLALGEVCLKINKAQDAMNMFKTVLEKQPNEVRAAWGIGYALKDMGKTQEAFQAFDRAFSVAPTDSSNNVRMGKAMLVMGRKAIGMNYFNSALDYDPNNLEAHLVLIPFLLKSARDRTAVEHIHIAMAMDPNNPALLLGLGYYNEMIGNLSEAIDYYEQASTFGAEAVEAKMRLARIYMGVGHAFRGKYFSNDKPDVKRLYDLCSNPPKALGLLKEVLILAPKHPEMQFIQDSISEMEVKVEAGMSIEP